MERTLSPTIAKAVAEAPSLPFRVRADHMHSTWAKTFSCRPELVHPAETVAESRACRQSRTTLSSPGDDCRLRTLTQLDNLHLIMDGQSGQAQSCTFH